MSVVICVLSCKQTFRTACILYVYGTLIISSHQLNPDRSDLNNDQGNNLVVNIFYFFPPFVYILDHKEHTMQCLQQHRNPLTDFDMDFSQSLYL